MNEQIRRKHTAIDLIQSQIQEELYFILDAIRQVQLNHQTWRNDYIYNSKTNEFRHKAEPDDKIELVKPWSEM